MTPNTIDAVYRSFVDPPREYTQIPFWFWNACVTEEGITHQLADFRDKGVYGFVIHPRMGLSESIPYLGTRYMELVRFAVDEAARHGMLVHLYDEAMYPSGSAHGKVVEGRPDLAAKGLAMRTGEPWFDPGAGEGLVGFVAWRVTPDGYMATQVPDADSVPPSDARGEWNACALVLCPTGGTIRGIHSGEDDGQPNAPMAADLLNPEATARFISITHDAYYRVLGDRFGTTVTAFFTDEPSLTGRGSRWGLRPWTDGFESVSGIPIHKLPLLWVEAGDESACLRHAYEEAIRKRLLESYYKPLSEWCVSKGVALTGHPADSDEAAPLTCFGLPGQDMVWRWVLPGSPEALEGPHSTVGKCSSSMARMYGRNRNGNEVFGAYGWRFNLDEMKWLMDWLFVRGVNLLWPHAFHYSIEGPRSGERPPCVGPNNLWWPYYRVMATYSRRLSWLMATRTRPPAIGIATNGWNLPWRLPKILLQNQVDFDYIPLEAPMGHGSGSFSHILWDGSEPGGVTPEECQRLADANGASVVMIDSADPDGVMESLRVAGIKPDLRPVGHCPDLRIASVQRGDVPMYLLTNEGEGHIAAELSLPVHGLGFVQWWDPLSGRRSRLPVLDGIFGSGLRVRIELPRRGSSVLVLADGDGNPGDGGIAGETHRGRSREQLEIRGPWTISDGSGNTVGLCGPVPWERVPGFDGLVGSVVYGADFFVDSPGLYGIDLGRVADIAETAIDGSVVGVAFWAPYTMQGVHLDKGRHRLTVTVTGSIAKALSPGEWGGESGLSGPVVLIREWIPTA